MAEGTNQVEAGWDIFAKIAVPDSAGESQRLAMRMSFLAGCDTILQLEGAIRDRGASHRVKTSFASWGAYVQNELRKIGMVK
jgi:hypothetical protein